MNQPRICVALAAQQPEQIETFIQDHIDRLPADVGVLAYMRFKGSIGITGLRRTAWSW